MITEKCPKCGDAGWLWCFELDDYAGPADETGLDDTKYSCDACTEEERKMRQLKVENTLDVLEMDDDDDSSIASSAMKLLVKSHYDLDNRVIIEVGGHSYTVLAQELNKAVENATNTRIG